VTGVNKPWWRRRGVICGGASPHPRWSRGVRGRKLDHVISPLGANPTRAPSVTWRGSLRIRERTFTGAPTASRQGVWWDSSLPSGPTMRAEGMSAEPRSVADTCGSTANSKSPSPTARSALDDETRTSSLRATGALERFISNGFGRSFGQPRGGSLYPFKEADEELGVHFALDLCDAAGIPVQAGPPGLPRREGPRIGASHSRSCARQAVRGSRPGGADLSPRTPAPRGPLSGLHGAPRPIRRQQGRGPGYARHGKQGGASPLDTPTARRTPSC